MERLLNTAEYAPLLSVRDRRRINTADKHFTGTRTVQSEQKLEHGAFSRPGTPCQSDLLAVVDRKTEVVKYIFLVSVTECHISYLDALASGHPFRGGNGVRALRKIQKIIYASYARNGRLHRLYLHSEAFDRREYLRNVIYDSNSGPDGHSEHMKDSCISRCRQYHDCRDRHCIEHRYHGRIYRVIEVRFFNGGIAPVYIFAVFFLHVFLFAEHMHGAYTPYGLGNVPRHPCDRCTIGKLRAKHALLHHARKKIDKRNDHQKQKRKPRALCQYNGKYADYPAGVGEHAYNAGREQRLYGINIAYKTRNDRSGLCRGKFGGSKCRQLFCKAAAHGVSYFLPEYSKQAFARGFEKAGSRNNGKIRYSKRYRNTAAVNYTVDHRLKDQRRRQRHGNSRNDGCDHADRKQKFILYNTRHNGRNIISFHFHSRPSAYCKARRIRAPSS